MNDIHDELQRQKERNILAHDELMCEINKVKNQNNILRLKVKELEAMYWQRAREHFDLESAWMQKQTRLLEWQDNKDCDKQV